MPDTGEPYLRGTPLGTELTLHIQPGASRAELIGLHGDALKVRIAARAVDGMANNALLEFIAQILGVPRRGVKILRGERSRRKVLSVSMPVQDVAEKVMRLLGSERVGM